MPNDSNYTKEPWVDPSKPVQSALPTRNEDLEVREFETHAKPRIPSGQENTNEAGGAVETKPTTETVTLSPQVTALACKEAKFRQSQQALKAREDALKAREEKLASLEALDEKLKAKDYSALDGKVDYDEYTNYRINRLNGSNPQDEALKKLSSEIESLKKSQTDNISLQFEAAVKERRSAVTALVESNPELSTIKEMKQQEAVVQHILDTWEHDEIDLSPEEAAKEVEELLVEEAKKWASITKIKPPEGEKKQLPPLKTAPKTITNQMTTSEAKTPLKSYQFMSESERYAEARRRVLEKQQKQG